MTKATRIWNRFDVGEWQEDTLVSGTARLIDGKNVTGLTTGLGLTIGPKVNNLLLTNGAMRNFFIDPDSNSSESRNFVYGYSGEIYRFDSLDYTPIYTHTTGGVIEGFFESGNDYFYQSGTGSTLSKSESNDFLDVDESYYGGVGETTQNVSYIVSKGNIYYPNGSQITKFDSSGVFIKNITGFSGAIKALIPTGGNLYAYTTNRVYGVLTESNADTISSESAIGFTVRGSTVKDGLTYLVTRDGELKTGNGRQFSNLSNRVLSNRLEDNSDYKVKFDFGTDADRGNTIAAAGKKIYVACNDDVPGIYLYDSIMPGFTKGLHKVITETHDGVAIDEVYCIAYADLDRRLYFAYKAGTEYGVDYIELNNKETAKLGYGVTEVFTANTTFVKKPMELRLTAEGVSGNNYIKLYERVNNGAWTLLETIQGEGILKKEIKRYTKENIEVQFKVELNNELQGTTPPILRELYFVYDVIEK